MEGGVRDNIASGGEGVADAFKLLDDLHEPVVVRVLVVAGVALALFDDPVDRPSGGGEVGDG